MTAGSDESALARGLPIDSSRETRAALAIFILLLASETEL